MALTRPKYSQIYDTDYKQSVRLATTAEVGNLLIAGSAVNSVDGKTVAVNDRILVKDQTDAKQNGIYTVVTVGTGTNGTWVRALDANANEKVTAGLTTIVAEGVVNAYSTFRLATSDPIIVGTTPLTFTNPFSAGAVAGTDGQIQFNRTGLAGASTQLTFTTVGNILTVGGTANISGNINAGGILTNNYYYANGAPISFYSDANTTAYLTANQYITATDLSVANTNMKGYVDGQISTTTTAITTANTNMKGYVDAANTIQSNQITGANSAITTANTNMKGYVDAANTIQSNQITGANSAITTANTNMKGYVDAANTIQSNQITGANSAITTANTNMKGYVDNALSSISSSKISANSSNVTVTASYVNVAINSSNIAAIRSTGLEILATTAATNTTSGALQVDGGAGIVGNLYAGNVQGTNLTGTVLTAAQPNITSVGTLTGLTVSGDVIANKFTSSNIFGNALTTGAAVFNGNAGAIVIDDSGQKRISWNDGGGNFNIRAGNYFNGVSLVYTKGAFDANGGATAMTMTSDAGDGVIALTVSSVQWPGNTVVWNQSVTLSTTTTTFTSGLTINSTNGLTAIANGGTNGVGNIGASGAGFNTVFAKSTSAQYADLAENYTSDNKYDPGTVVVFGGSKEVTASITSHDPSVAGVVSTNPAYLMNDTVDGAAVALQGRVPCRVLGPIAKGDRVVSSDVPGVAERLNMVKYQPGCIIGKSLETIETNTIQIIEVVVGRV